ncbi:MAG TPA: uroporphyrinogen-III synthase [Streptosporangiaceae bacterium]|nr:uroporphyrinogen-III synthase [Streptosporangiaceae bacterium]
MQTTEDRAAGALPVNDRAAETAPSRPGLLAFTGTGPGDAGLLTLRAAELIGQADVVVGSAQLTARVAHLVPETAAVLETGQDGAGIAALISAVQAGRIVVRLCPGDPLLFGQAAAEADACARAAIPLEIVPGMPAATAVPAYAGLPLTSDTTADMRVVHASELSRGSAEFQAAGSLVILGAEAGPADLAKMLMAAGWADATPMAITWNGTSTDQHTVLTKLSSVAADLKAAGVSVLTEDGPAIAVIGEAAGHRGLSWFENKPLFGWRVLVPRTKEQAASVSERLRSYGAVPQVVPTIAVEPPRAPQQMERAIKGLVTGRFQWIAFTSANAVRAVREKLEDYGLDARAFAGIKVAAVGEQTAAALGEFGIKPDLVPPEAEQSSEGLAAAWPPYDDVLDPINRVLLPRADIATETLVARLTELGWETEDVTAYRTVRAAPPPAPIREAIKGGGFDAVLFTSSSTVRNLIGIAGKPHAVTAVAVIGPQTAQTAAEYGLRVDVTAPRASATALVDALAEHGARLRDAALAAGEPVRRPSERRRGGRRRTR